MTVKDVSRRLDLSADTVRALERAGKLRATKTSVGWRLFDPRDVERFAAVREAAKQDRRG
jgi:excisionase family DNA binding protein